MHTITNERSMRMTLALNITGTGAGTDSSVGGGPYSVSSGGVQRRSGWSCFTSSRNRSRSLRPCRMCAKFRLNPENGQRGSIPEGHISLLEDLEECAQGLSLDFSHLVRRRFAWTKRGILVRAIVFD